MRSMAVSALGMIMALSLPVRADTTEANVTWNGDNPAAPGWDIPTNWTEASIGDNKAPANPTPGTLTFGTNGMAVTGVVDADRQVGGVTFGGVRYDPTITHIIDLNGRTLTVGGTILGTQWETQTLVFTNGTLRMGTATVAGHIDLGPSYGRRDLILRPGTILDAHNLGTLTLGHPEWGPGAIGRMDLRGAAVAGGVLTMQNLRIRTRRGATFGSYLYLDDATSLSRIEVANELHINTAHSGGYAYIGNPGDGGRLPPNISVVVGESPAARGEIWISRVGSSISTQVADGRLVAAGGGDFTAYVGNLDVVRQQTTRTGQTFLGILDIGAMTNCLIDAGTITVGADIYTTPSTGYDIRGELTLCPGVVTTEVAVVGATLGDGWGRLTLSNTLFRVTNSLTLHATGDIAINLDDESAGLDIDGALIDAGDGTIAVAFMTEPAAGTTNWAIRVAGDAIDTLAAMVGGGRLTSNGTFPGKKVGVLYDGDYTYYALVDEDVPFPPIAVAHAELTYELEAGGSVVLHVDDIDNGSYDPEGRPVTLAISSDGENFFATLSFTETGTNTVTLRVQANGDAATTTSEVAIVDVPPGDASANVTWSGEAATTLMARREWMWSENWAGGGPPAPVTTGEIRYRDDGQSVTGMVAQARQVGGINFGTDFVDTHHTVDLGGHVLTVAGDISRVTRQTQSLSFTNGTLRLGTDAISGNIAMGPQYGSGSLILRTGTSLDTHNLDTITLGYSEWGPQAGGVLDLRGAVVVGGALRMTNLTMRTGRTTASRIYLDGGTSIDRIEIAIDWIMPHAYSGNSGSSYVGDPNDGGRLPPNISLRLGKSPFERGRLWISRMTSSLSGSHTTQGCIEASGGGDFTAYLSELDIVRQEHSNFGTSIGVVDIRAMTNCLIDAQTIRVGTDTWITPSATHNIRGTLALCPGSVTAGTAVIGATDGVGWGILSLSNTAFTVTNTLTLAKTAQVTIEVGGASSGIDLTSAAPGAFTLDPDAVITVRFRAPAAHSGLYYGLRLAGDHVDTLNGLAGLMIDSSGLAGKEAQIFLFQGATHVGIPPPRGTLLLMR